MEIFINTLHMFMTPKQLLGKLIERYTPPAGVEVPTGLHLRVYLVLKHWITTQPLDFLDKRVRRPSIAVALGVLMHSANQGDALGVSYPFVR